MYPEVFSSVKDIELLDVYKLLKQGYTYLKIENSPKNSKFINKPIHLVNSAFKVPELKIKVGINATFLLKKEEKNKYVVINDFLINLEGGIIILKMH